MAKATEDIVLYNEEEKIILAVVKKDENYWIPENIDVFAGNLEDFLDENEDYEFENFEL